MNMAACLSVKQRLSYACIPGIVGGRIVEMSVHKARIINYKLQHHTQCPWGTATGKQMNVMLQVYLAWPV